MKLTFAQIPLLPVLLGIIMGIIISHFNWGYIVIAPIVMGLYALFSRNKTTNIVLISYILGVICSLIQTKPIIYEQLLNKELTFSGTISSIKTTDDIRNLIIDVDHVTDSATSHNIPSFKCRVSIPSLNPFLEMGNRVSFRGTINYIQDKRDLPDEFDIVKHLNQQGIYTQTFIQPEDIIISGNNDNLIWNIKRFRADVTHIISSLPISDECIEFLNATITGDASMISDDQRLKYSSTGLAHILALSGLHVGIITFFIAILLFPIDFIGRRKFKFIITIILLWTYALMTGCSPSVTRAVIMASIFFLSLILQRHHSPYNSLCFAAIIILVFSPDSLYNIGFQLSFAAVLSILLFAKKLNPINPKRRFPHAFMSLFAVSISAMIGTGIISAFYFHNFPTYFLLANAITAYLLPFIIIGGLIAILISALGYEPSLLSIVIEFIYNIIDSVISYITTLPGSNIDNIYFKGWLIIPFFAIIMCLYLSILHKKKIWYLFTVVFTLFFITMGYLTRPQYCNAEYFIPRNSYYTNIIVRDSSAMHVFSTARGGDSIDLIDKCAEKYKDYMGWRKVDSITLISNKSTSRTLKRMDPIISLGTDIIVIVDDDTDLMSLNLRPQYALVCRGFKGDILDVYSTLAPDTILLSRDIHKKRHNRYADSCQIYNIPYISLRDTCFHRIIRN